MGITQAIYDWPPNLKSATFLATVIKNCQEEICRLNYQELTEREHGMEALARFKPSLCDLARCD